MRVATVLVTNAHVRCPLSPREHIRAHVPSRALSLSPARQGGRVAGSAAEGLPAPLSFEPWTLEDVLSGGSVTRPVSPGGTLGPTEAAGPAHVRQEEHRPSWGRGGWSDGTGCEPLALSIPGCARRSACARGAPRTRSCAEPTSRRSTARCWAVSGTTPPTAAGTWAPGEPAPRVSVPRVGGGAPFARGPASSVAAARAVSRPRPSGPFTLRRAACPVAGVSCARFSLHGVPVLVLPDWAQLSRGAPRPPPVVGGPAEPSRRPQISVWEKRSRWPVPRGPPGRPSAERWGLLCAALLFSAGPTGPQEHSVAAGGRAREAPPARVRSARLSAVVLGAPLETH